MARLALMAGKYHCAIVAVRHLTKGGKDKAIYRGIGSIDFTAACRSVLLVGSDPDDSNRRAMVQIKNNLAEMGCSIGYEIRDGKFSWTGISTLTAGRILASEGNEEKSSALHNAEDFLREALSEGPIPAKQIYKEARDVGIAQITLSRAKQALGVKVRKEGRPGEKGQHWIWMLPNGQEDYHEGSQEEADDNLRPNRSDKEIKDSYLAEEYHSGARDNLRTDNDNLRDVFIPCNACSSQGVKFTHCDRCGEFLR
jgi:hypothetical protein